MVLVPIFCFSELIGATETMINELGGGVILPLIKNAEILQVSSTSIEDTYATGTGAWLIQINGLNQNKEIQSERIVLNGTNIVETKKEFLRVNEVLVILVGSATKNIGNITFTLKTSGTPISYISVGNNRNLSSLYTVPANHKAELNQVVLFLGKGKEMQFFFHICVDFGSPNCVDYKQAVTDQYESASFIRFDPKIEIFPKTDIYLTAKTPAGVIQASAYYSISIEKEN